MKEELKSLKDSTQKILKATQSFQKQKEFFNMKVEERNSELNIEEILKEQCDSYQAAKELNECFPNIHTIVSRIREEHPKYGNKRIKQLLVNEFMLQNDSMVLYESDLDLIMDNYFLYESCGFFKLYEQEKEIEALGKEAREATDAILDESKEAAIKVGKSVVNIVKPYGEVAKSQLNDAGEAAKRVVNKGSQKLKVFFENLEKKTKTK